MRIHSYQIRNVLNVYRQQLTRGTSRNASGRPNGYKAEMDRMDISDHGQRRSLFEKISSEIVQRITQFGPDTEIKTSISGHLAESGGRITDKHETIDRNSPQFSYTLIDNNNRKTTHNLSVRQLIYSAQGNSSQIASSGETESALGSD